MNKKKFFSYLFMGLLTIGVTGTVTSCKDYDDDINNLQEQIDANKKLIEQIQALIQSGSIITNVTSTEGGVTLTLSNGQSYSITNGKDGAAGKDGDAWTIGDDNYWYKNGEKTQWLAVGQKGDKGDSGVANDYVYANEDGYFHKVTVATNGNKTDENTNVSWKNAAVSGIMDTTTGYVTLGNVKFGDNDYRDVKISLNNNLRGFSFVTDAADDEGKLLDPTIVDGVEAIQVQSFIYTPQQFKSDTKNKATEELENLKNAKADTISPTVYAYYKVEPAEASAEDLAKLSYRVSANAKYISTRAAGDASNNFGVAAKFVSFENGILKVQVNVSGEAAKAVEAQSTEVNARTRATSESKISLVSLQATKRNNEVVEQSDDPETIYQTAISNLRIANKEKFESADKVNWDYRSKMNTGETDDRMNLGATATKPAFSTTDGSDIDVEVPFDGSIDLNNYVQLHEASASACGKTPIDAARFGFTYSYELVDPYKIGTNNTNQNDFVTLSGSTITPKVFNDTQREAAIGRTPLVRVTLKNAAGQIVQVGYIKLQIVRKATPNKTLTLDMPEAKFACAGYDKTTTVEQMNTAVYNVMSMSRDEFHNDNYPVFDADNYDGTAANWTKKGDQIGKVAEKNESINGETTHLLQWTIPADTLYKYAGKEIQHTVYYRKDAGSSVYVAIQLKTTVTGIAHSYNITKASYINEYWDANKTYAKFNVRTPNNNESKTDNCVYKNDLNSAFTQAGRTGIIALPEVGENVVAGVDYAFDVKSMKGEKSVGNINVRYSFGENDADTLNIYGEKITVANGQKQYGTKEKLATITNGQTSVPKNFVEVNAESSLAKELLNTGVWDVNYTLYAEICDANKKAKVTFNGEDYFTARFVRPLTIAAKANNNFVDGVNFGTEGSWITLEDLVNPTDWRNLTFTGDNAFLWGYYGVTAINADKDKAEANLNGTWAALPSTITLDQVNVTTAGTAEDVKIASGSTEYFTYKTTQKNASTGETETVTKNANSKYGVLTYRNNGTTVQSAFQIRVPVKVSYKWGDLTTTVTIDVAKTIGQAKKH